MKQFEIFGIPKITNASFRSSPLQTEVQLQYSESDVQSQTESVWEVLKI